jgi:hypothetical protein
MYPAGDTRAGDNFTNYHFYTGIYNASNTSSYDGNDHCAKHG